MKDWVGKKKSEVTKDRAPETPTREPDEKRTNAAQEMNEKARKAGCRRGPQKSEKERQILSKKHQRRQKKRQKRTIVLINYAQFNATTDHKKQQKLRAFVAIQKYANGKNNKSLRLCVVI